MSKYTDEDRARIFAEAHAAISAAEASLAEPRPQLAEPPVEDKLQKWRREAREQEERFARERAAGWPLTDYERVEFERNTLSAMVADERAFTLQLLAELVAELRHEFDQKVAELNAEIGQLRAEATIAKAFAKGEPGGEIVDLPAWPRKSA